MHRFALSFAAALAASAVSAYAGQTGQGVILRWKLMDVCSRQAQAAHPDYSAESNAKRDAQLKQCLNANGLPPRQPSATPGPR
ncbi:MAG: hypothetical protein J2P48_00130 [Alphaproteobacteria bacterium]|nr:hypothetical protein [Alphaproteobacteria bacterium]